MRCDQNNTDEFLHSHSRPCDNSPRHYVLADAGDIRYYTGARDLCPPSEALLKLRVLLVEDNPLNQELVRDLLEVAGHEVTVAANGEALRALVAGDVTPNVILMDILLPGKDGVTLLHELRTQSAFSVVPIVAVTAQALAGDRQHFLAAGFNGVLTKPIDTRTFVAEVERYATRG